MMWGHDRGWVGWFAATMLMVAFWLLAAGGIVAAVRGEYRRRLDVLRGRAADGAAGGVTTGSRP